MLKVAFYVSVTIEVLVAGSIEHEEVALAQPVQTP
jgi:hypothetical protein